MNKRISSRVLLVPTVAALALLWASVASAATITSTLDVGARGSNVTSLQQFLAADATLYPEGLVTGYYGSLTAAAVQRLQCREGIVCSGTAASTGYGRVGPRTLAAINAMIDGGSSDVSAPVTSRPIVSTTTTTASFSWVTSELARGTVYYSVSPLPLLEGSATTQAVVGGQPVGEISFASNHSVTVPGLVPNTVYFYAVKSEDASGNVAFTWPASFKTAQ